MAIDKVVWHIALLATGMATVTAWAPFGWWPVSFLGYGFLYARLRLGRKTFDRGISGLAFGLGLNAAGHGWTYTTLVGPVGMNFLSALLGSFTVILGLASFTATACMMQFSLNSRIENRFISIVCFASAMTLFEYLRAIFFDRFSSLSLGYSLIDTWLSGFAPLVGTYGLSWVAYCIIALIAEFIFGYKTSFIYILKHVLILAFLITIGASLQSIQWTSPIKPILTFRLLQPNIQQDEKFNYKETINHIKKLENLLTTESADLIITPETAFPVYWESLPKEVIKKLQEFSKKTGSNLIFGIASVGSMEQGHNSMMHIRPNGQDIFKYDKIHMFPFGEYIPSGFEWISRSTRIPMSDLSSGANDQSPFDLYIEYNKISIGTIICHENMMSDESIRWANKVNLLINPSNMSWFDGTLALDHSLQITRMRALEIGRPILRVSNTGDTALILSSGDVADKLPRNQTSSLTGSIFGARGSTPFALFGNTPIIIFCLVSFVFLSFHKFILNLCAK